MTKVSLIADIHLGLGKRHQDIIWALNTVRQYNQDNGINYTFILGDLFHSRDALSIDVLCAAHEFFKETKEMGQTWIAFPGNHDMFLKHSWKVNSIKPLSEVLTFIDTVKIIDIDGKRFWILPFVYSESAYNKILSKIEEQYQDGDILLTHIGVCTAKLNVCFLLQTWNIIDFRKSKFKRVYTGHFHLNQQVGDNLWYPGSLIPFKFDEGDSPHGFYVYDIEADEHEFIDVWDIGDEKCAAPKYINLHDTLLDEKKASDVKGCNIRVAATQDYTPHERQEIRDKLTQLGARQVVFTDMLRDDDDIKIEIDESEEIVPISDMFQKWYDLDSKGTKGLQRNLALRLNREIVSEGDEIYKSQMD